MNLYSAQCDLPLLNAQISELKTYIQPLLIDPINIKLVYNQIPSNSKEKVILAMLEEIIIIEDL